MMKWNHKPRNGWTQRKMLPDRNRQVVWRDNSGEIMAGTYNPDNDIFMNTYLTTYFVALPPTVIEWAYIDSEGEFNEWAKTHTEHNDWLW